VVGEFSTAVTGFAIGCPNGLVIEISLRPINCVMTGRTLPCIVIHWLVYQMAKFTILTASQVVIEINLLPGE
jgi:hypothetical protein